MKKLKKFIFILSCLSVTSSLAITQSTGPALHNRCSTTVATPPNGTEVLFDEACTTAYVKPPRTGTAEVGSLARTTNLQFCSAVKSIETVAEQTVRSMAYLSGKVNQMIESFEPLENDLLELKISVASAKVKMDIAKKRMDDAEKKMESLHEVIRQTRMDFKGCVEAFSAEDPGCVELKQFWELARQDAREFRREEYTSLQENVMDRTEDHNILASRFSLQESRYRDAIEPMVEMQGRISRLNNNVVDLYNQYAGIEGATGQITWSIPWDKLLADYQRLNPNLRVTWMQVPIKEAELNATVHIPGSEEALVGLSAIKAASIPGAKPTGFWGMGSGQKVEGAQLKPGSFSQASLVFGNSISGHVVLTLAGACPYFEDIANRTAIDTHEISKHMAANVVYTYELAARKSYRASYNLSALLTKIEDKTKRGGYFSTRNAHDIIEDGGASEWFSIDFGANTAEFQYSEQERKQIERELKQELMDKAVRQFAILNAGASITPAMPEFVESGSRAASDALRICQHYYCQAGSLILGVADSIWGRNDAAANFHRNNGAWVMESVNGIQYVNRSGSVAF